MLKERLFWPNMFRCVHNFVSSGTLCQQVKPDTRPAKAPLVPMVIPTSPMQFISMDIAYLPKDRDSYQYILLIGDIFPSHPVTRSNSSHHHPSFSNHWLYIHGSPSYLLSDQGSNVDGDVIREFCDKFDIKKRRSSPYHSQGNGFAERSIRSVKEMLRAILL